MDDNPHTGDNSRSDSPAPDRGGDGAPQPQGGAPGSRDDGLICPACGSRLVRIRCKCVCQSEICGYRIVYTCCEF